MSRTPMTIVRMTYGEVMRLTCNYQVRACPCFDFFSPRLFAGAPLWKILEAGEWRSPAFLTYLDINRLEADVVVQAHLDESDSDHD